MWRRGRHGTRYEPVYWLLARSDLELGVVVHRAGGVQVCLCLCVCVCVCLCVCACLPQVKIALKVESGT